MPEDRVGQRVVDDARMADHHEHGSRARQLEALDLEPQPEQRADAREVAREPEALEAVDALAPLRAVAAA